MKRMFHFLTTVGFFVASISASAADVKWVQIQQSDFKLSQDLIIKNEQEMVRRMLPDTESNGQVFVVAESDHGEPHELDQAIANAAQNANDPTANDHFLRKIPKLNNRIMVDSDVSNDYTRVGKVRAMRFYGMQMRLNQNDDSEATPTHDFRMFGGYMTHHFDEGDTEFENRSALVGISYWMAIGQ